LSSLLSQTLVAYTVEFDNQFERRMMMAGYRGACLSLVVWSNLMRFLTNAGQSVRDLAAQALAPEAGLNLGCLERWGFVVLQADPADERPVPKRLHARAGRLLRDGWGSGRGIRADWLVHLTEKGRQATEIWPSLFGEIERRWEARFGNDQVEGLRQALGAVVDQLEFDLPQALPMHCNDRVTYAKQHHRREAANLLPVLLSQLLLAFTLEFEQETRVPLWLCANTLRALEQGPVPLRDIPRLTGASPETSDIGWQAKPYVAIEPDPAARRGKVVRLTPRGLEAQRTYHRLVHEIEERWQTQFGQEKTRRLRDYLRSLFAARNGDRLLISEGLVPAEGTVRAGAQAPALGRRGVGAAARQRMRDLVAQTEMFVRDPVNALPRYPLWDMNRGFGP